MKKRTTQSLQLNKKSISKLDSLIITGGDLSSFRETFPLGVCTCNYTCQSVEICPPTELETAQEH
ncbi:hypothetical protein [Kordia jejudonensis]|uniref:hypothetical protein n=1 Tax=Kordia jejudonensis TaxID=1348245 RepID=UPI000629628D|nr:hypothetical protein [Kordia jejudonensis]